MKLLADECCDAGLVDALRHDGYDIVHVVDSMRGASDTEVLDRANREDRILLTEDKDFGELVYRFRRSVPGIILLRFDPKDKPLKYPRLRTVLERGIEELQGSLVVIDSEKARIRPLI